MLWILIAVTCIELSTFANAQSKKTTSMQEDANNTEPDHPSKYFSYSSLVLFRVVLRPEHIKRERRLSSKRIVATLKKTAVLDS